jgi:outer membrane protein assembly factor BamB
VVAGGKIFVGTNNASPRNPRDSENGKPVDKSVLMCFRVSDGRFLWQHVNDKLDDRHAHDWPGIGICSTPWVEGDRLWYVTNRCEVVCLDVEGLTKGGKNPSDEKYNDPTDARVIWRFDMRKGLGVQPLRASASSPIVVGDLVYVVTGHGTDSETGEVTNPDAPSFLALDKKTGQVVWKDSSPGKDIQHGQWSSPAYGIVDGKQQVVFAGGDGKVRGFDPKTGQRLWEFDGNPSGTKPEHLNHFVAAPAIHNGWVYIGTGRNPEYPDGPGTLWCISFDRGKPNIKWARGFTEAKAPSDYVGRTISTCAIEKRLLYSVDLQGKLLTIGLETGLIKGVNNLKASTWASPLCADGKLFVATAEGDVFVFEQMSALAPSEKLKLLTKIEMNEPIRATPVAVSDVLYILTEKHLYAIQKGK